MAITRFGHLDDFTQKNNKVGIGTSTPQDKMEVIGGTRSTDLRVAGIATLTSAGGFIEKHIEYVEDQIIIDAGDSGTLSGEIVVGSGLTMTVGTAATTSQGTVDALKVYDMFQPPSGGTNQRPPAKTGAIFYNFDFKTIEFFDGNSWRQVDNTTRRGRGIISSGNTGSFVTRIESVDLASQGNSTNFGDNTLARQGQGGCSSNTRGIFGGGYNGPVSPGVFNTIDYVTIPSGGNAIDFGDLTETASNRAAVSSQTRGIIGTGLAGGGNSNVMAYVQFTTIGNALDFGDLTEARYAGAGLNSPTRGLFAGGNGPTAVIDLITIASTGNSTKFGDLTVTRGYGAGCSNSVRGLIMGGGPGANSNIKKTIDYVTIASEGNATDFGTLSTNKWWGAGVSSATRGFIAGGYSATGAGSGSRTNVIEFVNIMSSGSATDYGDLSEPIAASGGCSDSHGGLGGY